RVTGDITDAITNNLSGPNILLETTQGNVNIQTPLVATFNLAENVGVTDTTGIPTFIIISAAGASSVHATNLTATTLAVSGGVGGINAGLTATNVMAKAFGGGSVTMTDTIAGNLVDSPVASTNPTTPGSFGTNFSFTAPSITVSGHVTADPDSGTLTLHATAGNIDIQSSLSANTIVLNASHNITQENALSNIISSSTTHFTAGGDIGAVGNSLNTGAQSVTLNLTGTGQSVYLFNANANRSLDLSGFNGANFSLVELGDIHVNGEIIATGNVG